MSLAEEFLIRAHNHSPGMTSRVFGPARSQVGLSSYEHLVEALGIDSQTPAILDVACGDGRLLAQLRRRWPGSRLSGVDISSSELTAARLRPELACAELLCARAQALPFEEQCFDVIVSHLAFMLMGEVDTVVSELFRVLLPRGLLAFIVPGKWASGAGPLLERILRDHLGAQGLQPIEFGDPRMRRKSDLLGVFEKSFTELACVDLPLVLDGPEPAVWAILESTYSFRSLPPMEQAIVASRFHSLVEPLVRPDMTVPLRLDLWLVTGLRS